MYKYANKHIELFKQIPFKSFSSNVDFFERIINNPNKYGTFQNILKCYYFIADEMWDQHNNKPLMEYDQTTTALRFYDFVKKRFEILRFVPTKRFRKTTIVSYKRTKMLNGLLDKDGKNKHFKKCHGLRFKNKINVPKKEVQRLTEDFLRFSYMYERDFYFYKKNKFEMPEDWVEHLYMILSELLEISHAFYTQPKSIMLAEEMVNILSNHFIIVYSMNLIRAGNDREKVMRQLKEKKLLMFGELQKDARTI